MYNFGAWPPLTVIRESSLCVKERLPQVYNDQGSLSGVAVGEVGTQPFSIIF
jgi:hypothetical protein